MRTGWRRATMGRTARALPALLLLWLPFAPPGIAAPTGASLLSGPPPPAALAETSLAGSPIAGARPCAGDGSPGAPQVPPTLMGLLPWTAPRAADAALPAIRTAPPGPPGRPNLARAPPARA